MRLVFQGFSISVIVEVSLDLEGDERKKELDKLFKVSFCDPASVDYFLVSDHQSLNSAELRSSHTMTSWWRIWTAMGESTRSGISASVLLCALSAAVANSPVAILLARCSISTRDMLLTAQAEFVLLKLRQMGVVNEEDITLCRQLFHHLVSIECGLSGCMKPLVV